MVSESHVRFLGVCALTRTIQEKTDARDATRITVHLTNCVLAPNSCVALRAMSTASISHANFVNPSSLEELWSKAMKGNQRIVF